MFRFLVRRPVAVTMLLLAVAVLGVVSARRLPVSLVPDTDIPVITVRVTSPDRSARELYELMVSPMRLTLSQTPGLEDMECTVRDGSAVISMKFDYGRSNEYVLIDVNERVDRAMRSWPAGEERPIVSRSSVTDIPAFFIDVTLKDCRSERDFVQMGELVRQVVSRRLEQLPQVAMVDMSGVTGIQYDVVPDTRSMAAAGLSKSDLAAVIGQADINFGNLTIADGDRSFDLRFESVVTGPEDLENIWMNIGGRALKTGDMASVYEMPQPVQGYVLSNGKRAVTMAVVKKSDARMADLKNSVTSLLESFEEDYPDLEFTLTRDQTALLDYSIVSMLRNLALGAMLVCLVIFLFMRDFTSSVLVTLTIPASLLMTFIVFHIIGISLNVISLSGLLLGIGMTVDNSIVVIDNISRHRMLGRRLEDACVEGTSEVFAPMLSSVLTTCVIFIPLIFINGVAGALFYDEAMAVTISLLSAFLVSVAVLPVYCCALFRRKPEYAGRCHMLDRITETYERLLSAMFRRRAAVWAAVGATVVMAVVLFPSMDRKKLPEMSHSDALLTIGWNGGTGPGENMERCSEITERFSERIRHSTVMAGIQQFALPHTAETAADQAVIYIDAGSEESMKTLETDISSYIRERWPNAEWAFSTSGNVFDVVFASDEPFLEARIRKPDGSSVTPAFADSLMVKLPGIAANRPAMKQYLELQAKTETMAMYGIGLYELESFLKDRIGNEAVRRISRGSVMIPVKISSSESDGDGILDGCFQTSDLNVPLDALLGLRLVDELSAVTAGMEGEYLPLQLDAVSDNVNEVMESLKRMSQDEGWFDVSFAGSYFNDRKLVRQLFSVLGISLILLFLILAAQFESLVQPLIVMSELVFDIALVIVVLKISGISLNLMSVTGLVVMCGIVINDSILKIDTVNRLRKRGMGLVRSILEAGKMRLDAILMTSLTTILAMLPFLARGDMGSDLQYPMSVALIAGMTAGTLASIFLVPLVYYVSYRRT